MSVPRKRSWPHQPGLWWLRDISIYAPGSIWKGRQVKGRAHIERWKWRVVNVLWVDRDHDRVQVEESGHSLNPSYFICRPTFSFHRQEWLPAIPPV